jgi:two-component system nitrogen regulation response regulator NtrX
MSDDILIVDDERDICSLVAGILSDANYEPRMAYESDGALDAVRTRKPSLILLDIWLQGSRLDGLELLSELVGQYTDIPIIMISGHGNIQTAVSAIRAGAFDYIEKPFNSDKLLVTVKRALESRRLNQELQDLRRKAGVSDRLVGTSAQVERLNTTLEKIAGGNGRVLMSGPKGSGRDLAARLIHRHSQRAERSFITMSSSLYRQDVLEEVLFGTESDTRYDAGLIEQAHGGSLYIDDIDVWPLELQSKFLKFLVDQQFQRIGGAKNIQVNVRVMAASSRDIGELIEAGTFLRDLYHRLCVVGVTMPALRERREDIPDLVKSFTSLIAQQFNMKEKAVDVSAMAVLQSYDWPGNIRQLRNCVEHMMMASFSSGSELLSYDSLPGDILNEAGSAVHGPSSDHLIALPLREAREVFEREYLMAQINRFGGNISRTANFVGMERSALHRKLRSLGVSTNAKD